MIDRTGQVWTRKGSPSPRLMSHSRLILIVGRGPDRGSWLVVDLDENLRRLLSVFKLSEEWLSGDTPMWEREL